MVSAVQVGGRRLHSLAREGIEVERAARAVTVDRFDVAAAVEPGVFPISVTCSSGTFVRSLAADLGAALGGGAHLRRLRRTAIGSFELDGARTLDELEVVGADAVLSPAAALRDYEPLIVDDDAALLISRGRPLDPARLTLAGTGPWAVVDQEGSLLAVYEAVEGLLKPAVVLPGE
jgi:tRNA pseudouridine55 synthase